MVCSMCFFFDVFTGGICNKSPISGVRGLGPFVYTWNLDELKDKKSSKGKKAREKCMDFLGYRPSVCPPT